VSVVAVVVTVLLVASAALTTVRMLRGPSTLDRVVATDVLVAIAMCGVAAFSALSGDSSVLAVVVALTLLGFVGSVSIVRFRVEDDA
jgi:multicomponent Na+:H+ antiporter subunit F